MAVVSHVKLPLDECNWTLLMLSQYRFRQWIVAVSLEAITWGNVDPDLCNHMASLGHNEIKAIFAGSMVSWHPSICYGEFLYWQVDIEMFKFLASPLNWTSRFWMVLHRLKYKAS